jgi:hypothetical protein
MLPNPAEKNGRFSSLTLRSVKKLDSRRSGLT